MLDDTVPHMAGGGVLLGSGEPRKSRGLEGLDQG